VIVCGVLIAIALEQTVEALHHRAQAGEMIRKLRDESRENRRVVDHDLAVCKAEDAVLDKDIGLIGEAMRAGRAPGPLDPLPPRDVLRPANAAWITIRDSALLPIMPKLVVDNWWKIDVTNESLATHNSEAQRVRYRMLAQMDAAHERPADPAQTNDLLLTMHEFQETERTLCRNLGYFRDDNEKALAGRPIDGASAPTKAGPEA
jgi:hypothetical protein